MSMPVRQPKPQANQNIELKSARAEDVLFSWKLYVEAVKPHIAPHIKARFNRAWDDDAERTKFQQWWTPQNTFIVMADQSPVGWLHFEETDTEITLVNYCVAADYRRQGIGSTVLQTLIADWTKKNKPLVHSVLKGSTCRTFFEKRGFELIGEDEITFILKHSATG